MKRLLCLILSLSLLLTGVLPYFAASGDRSAAMDTRQSGRLFAPLRHLRTRLTGDALFCGTLRFFPQTTLPCRAELTKADGSTETLRLRPQDGCVTLRLDENVVSLVIRPDA